MFNTILMAALLASSVTALPAPQKPDALNASLGKVVKGFSVSEDGFPRAILRVAEDFHIPLGMEWIKLQSDPQPVRLSWRQATVRQVLESIAKSRAGYNLEVRDGIVHVFYTGAATDKSNFLNLKIEKFQAQSEYVASARQRLHGILNRITFPPPPTVPGEHHSTFREVVVSAGDHTTSFGVQNGTVRDVLDKMALATDGKMWVVTFDKRAGLMPTGFRRTIASLWNTYSLPDQYQPGWDLIFVPGTAVPSESSRSR